MTLSRLTSTLLATLGAATLACSGGSSASPQTAARTEVAVAISPGQIQVAPGATVSFAATVTGVADTSVTWSVEEAGGGTVDAAGAYQAPQVEGTYHVVARSVADPSASAAAAVTVSAAPVAPPPPSTTPIAVTISPATAAVSSCQSVTLTARVTGTTNTAVSWTVQEGTAGGSVSAAGVYTAPAIAGTYHVVGTSQADPTRSQVVPVVVTDRILSVAVAPSTVSLVPGQSAQFTATVTTTCGAYTSTSTVTAPATAAN